MNNKESSTEPCDTTHLHCNKSDIQSNTSTYCISLVINLKANCKQ